MTRYARSLAACKHLTGLPEFADAETVMVFLSLPDEVDVAAVALAAWQRDKTVAAPTVDWKHHRMTPVQITSLESGLKVGRHGIPEPAGGQPVPVEMIDMILAPGFAFDREGQRLGRGGGFYDRLLAQPGCRATICGIGFSEQIVPEVKVEAHDRPVDLLVTDEEVLRFDR